MPDGLITINLGPIFWGTLIAGLALVFYLFRSYYGPTYGSIRVESDDRPRPARERRNHEEEDSPLPPPGVLAALTGLVVFVMVAMLAALAAAE